MHLSNVQAVASSTGIGRHGISISGWRRLESMTVELDLREKSRPQCSRLLMSATSHGQRLAAIHKAGFLRGGVQRGNLTLQGGTGKLRRRLLASRSSHGYEEARHLLDLACRFSSGHCMAMEALLLCDSAGSLPGPWLQQSQHMHGGAAGHADTMTGTPVPMQACADSPPEQHARAWRLQFQLSVWDRFPGRSRPWPWLHVDVCLPQTAPMLSGRTTVSSDNFEKLKVWLKNSFASVNA